jgi:hypothetical protein
MSIRWIRNVSIDGEKGTVEIQLGDHHLGDKCYTRINNEFEQWFQSTSDKREEIIAQGVEILKMRLEGKTVSGPDGEEFSWK